MDKDNKKSVLNHLRHLIVEAERGEIEAFAIVVLYDAKEHKYGGGPATSIVCNSRFIDLFRGVTTLKKSIRQWLISEVTKVET